MSASGGDSPARRNWRTRTEYDYLLKLIIVGDEGAGKSSLMNRFCEDGFSHSYVATIGVDFKVRTVLVDVDDEKISVKMQMWDTAGQERFSSITTSFYRGADAVFVMYDITSRHTFNKVAKWLKGCTDVLGEDVAGALVGNKLDLEKYREVTLEDGQEMGRRLGLPHFETSAKTDVNVDAVFQQIAQQYARQCHDRRVGLQSRRGAEPADRGGKKLTLAAEDPDTPGCWAWIRGLFSWRHAPATKKQPDFVPASAAVTQLRAGQSASIGRSVGGGRGHRGTFSPPVSSLLR